jgi:hypothetical protein
MRTRLEVFETIDDPKGKFMYKVDMAIGPYGQHKEVAAGYAPTARSAEAAALKDAKAYLRLHAKINRSVVKKNFNLEV